MTSLIKVAALACIQGELNIFLKGGAEEAFIGRCQKFVPVGFISTCIKSRGNIGQEQRLMWALAHTNNATLNKQHNML